jgi:hypothetical protein
LYFPPFDLCATGKFCLPAKSLTCKQFDAAIIEQENGDILSKARADRARPWVRQRRTAGA